MVFRLFLLATPMIFGIEELIYNAGDHGGRIYLLPIIIPVLMICYLFGMRNLFQNELIAQWWHCALLLNAVLWAGMIAALYWKILSVRRCK